jgi:hypothetical protein
MIRKQSRCCRTAVIQKLSLSVGNNELNIVDLAATTKPLNGNRQCSNIPTVERQQLIKKTHASMKQAYPNMPTTSCSRATVRTKKQAYPGMHTRNITLTPTQPTLNETAIQIDIKHH